jgi:hypothetical protein
MWLESCFWIQPKDDILFNWWIISKISIPLFSEIFSSTRPELDKLLWQERELFLELWKFLINWDISINVNSEYAKTTVAKIRLKWCSFNDKNILSIALNSVFWNLDYNKKIEISRYFYLFNVWYLHKFREFIINEYNNKDKNDKITFLSDIVKVYYWDTNLLLSIFESLWIDYSYTSSAYNLLINPLKTTESNIIKWMANSWMDESEITKYSSLRRIFNI